MINFAYKRGAFLRQAYAYLLTGRVHYDAITVILSHQPVF